MLVVAGAGSGKTETMATRVLWLVANGHVLPHEVLGLTFTRKASIELSTRLGDRLRGLRRSGLMGPPASTATPGAEVDPDVGLGAVLESPTVSTYHAYAGRLVAEHGLRIGVEPHARVLSEAACWQLAHQVVHTWTGPMPGLELAENTVVQAVLDLSAALSEHLVEPHEVHEWLLDHVETLEQLPPGPGTSRRTAAIEVAGELARKALVLPLVTAYREAKRARAAVDFGDQVAVAARLARDVPAVGVSERSRFRAVLLDEFQDTSEAQMVLLSSLFAPRPGAGAAASPDDQSAASPGVPVVAVGDPHQSIYGWRGASATTLRRFPHRFAPTGQDQTPVRSLSTSWRNARRVLEVANTVAEPLRRDGTIPVSKLRPAPGAPEGDVRVLRSPTHLDEAVEVARWVASRWLDAQGRWTGSSAAVLCRNRSQFEPLATALRREGLPVEIVGLGGLLDAPELIDIVSLLWVVQEPSRGDAVMRLLVGPVGRLGAADVSALWSWARHLVADYPQEEATLGEALDRLPPPGWFSSHGAGLTDTAHRRLTGLSRAVTRLRSLVGLPLADLLIEAERALGLDIEVSADPDVAPGWARAHLDALVEVASAFAATADRPTLGGFLSWLDAAREHERALEDVEVPELAEVSVQTGAVQLMTVHAAKGLEWDVVAVPGLAEGVFPVLPGRSRSHPSRSSQADPVPQWSYRPHAVNGWRSGIGALPYPLRGDREGLPELDLAGQPDAAALKSALAQFATAGIEHRVREERRLAYVAMTRARREMLLSAPVWSTTTRPRVTSRFLGEVVDADAARSAGGLSHGPWTPMPVDESVENPLAAAAERAQWPAVPGQRRATMTDLVETVLATPSTIREVTGDSDIAADRHGGRGPREPDQRDELIAMLLAEREERQGARHRGRRPAPPSRLSTSSWLALAADPERFARRLRRPMPAPPSPAAEVGTRFHAWVEQHYNVPVLLDWQADGAEEDTWPIDGDLGSLQERFLASEWAARTPVAVEMSVSTTVAGRSISARIDAVFPRPDGGFTVVDWKTGRPGTDSEQRHRRLQLAVYRLAYARWSGIDLDRVDAAFFYAGTGQTVRPLLPDLRELETQLDTALAGLDGVGER